MAQINIRIEDELKARADMLFEELGLNTTTAINMFFRQALRQGGIPFDVTLRGDPFWSEENQLHLKQVITEYESGNAKLITKAMEELEDMANE